MSAVFLGWTLADTAAAVSGDLIGGDNRTIGAVTTDSRGDVQDHLFVALEGESFDGHAFASDVITAGAVAVVVNKGSGITAEPRIEVDSTRKPATLHAQWVQMNGRKMWDLTLNEDQLSRE